MSIKGALRQDKLIGGNFDICRSQLSAVQLIEAK
jgi:hypothetical protein